MSTIIATNNPQVFRVEGSFVEVFAKTKNNNIKIRFTGERDYIYQTDVKGLIDNTFKAMASHDGQGFSKWFAVNVRNNPLFEVIEVTK